MKGCGPGSGWVITVNVTDLGQAWQLPLLNSQQNSDYIIELTTSSLVYNSAYMYTLYATNWELENMSEATGCKTDSFSTNAIWMCAQISSPLERPWDYDPKIYLEIDFRLTQENYDKNTCFRVIWGFSFHFNEFSGFIGICLLVTSHLCLIREPRHNLAFIIALISAIYPFFSSNVFTENHLTCLLIKIMCTFYLTYWISETILNFNRVMCHFRVVEFTPSYKS